MVLNQVGWMAAIGVPLGLVAAFALGLAASSLLFGLSTDAPAVFGAFVLLAAVVLVAS